MQRSRPSVRVWLSSLVLAAASIGCGGGGAFHMRAAQGAATIGTPPEGRAQVVFTIPERSRDVVSIVDQRGTYYGQLRAETSFVVDVAPGRYRFYAIRDRNGYAVDVPLLEAGQVAYVGGIDPLITGFVWRSFTGCDVDATRARSALSSVARMEPDPAVSSSTAIAEIDDLPRRTGEADRQLDAMNAADRALRTVGADDLARGGRCDGSAPSTTSGD